MHPISIDVVPGTGVASANQDAYSQKLPVPVDAVRAGHGKRLYGAHLETSFWKPLSQGDLSFHQMGKSTGDILRPRSAAHPHQ